MEVLNALALNLDPGIQAIIEAPMDVGALPHGERLSPELKIKLAREGKCFYCWIGNHLAINCPLKQQHRFPTVRRQ